MKYALNLTSGGRILSATYEEYAAPGMPIVDNLPEGDISNYLYINGEFIYDPIPQPEPQPTADDLLNILLGVSE